MAFQARIPDAHYWLGRVPCQTACPVRTDAGKYVQLVAENDDRASYLVARSPNPFASVCGRVCAAPCEDACRRGKIDQPVSIRALKRFVCERYGVESLAPDTQDELFAGLTEPGNKHRWHLPVLTRTRKSVARGQKVAVVGGGPAGLACAHDLALMGYRVTLFEATRQLGGMMVHGIPEFRLPRSIIHKEIDKILSLGVEVRYQQPLGPTFGLRQLRQEGFAAIFLAVGAQRGRDLKVEGSELDGVVKAIEFLLNINRGYRVPLGKRVVVVGGGFVAFDAARVALRAALATETETAAPAAASEQETGTLITALDAARAALRAGVADVRIVSLESFSEMPVLRTTQGKDEFEEARREGVRFHPQRGVQRILGSQGRVASLELIGVRRTYDEQGRFNPVYDPSIRETLEADTVILAVGQQPDLSFLHPEDGIEITPQGTIRIDPETLATTAPGVFAGGDVAFGPRNLIDAIANGKRAALSIDEYLRSVQPATRVYFSFQKIPTAIYGRAAGYEQLRREPPPVLPLDRRTGITEVEVGYAEPAARAQALRCLYCHVQTIYDPSKCVLCNRCVDVCPEHCLKLVPLEELDIPEEERAVLAALGAGSGGSAMLKDDERCIRCGLCAIRCPTDAMTMEVLSYEEAEVHA